MNKKRLYPFLLSLLVMGGIYFFFNRSLPPLEKLYPGELTQVDQIEIRHFAELHTVTDPEQIADWIDKVKDIRYKLEFNQWAKRSGNPAYTVFLYENKEQTFIFSTSKIKNKYYFIDDALYQAIDALYKSQ